MSASKLCPCCRRPIKQIDERITCIGMCKKTYHVGCARLVPEEYSNYLTSGLKWMCHSCKCSSKKDVKKALTQNLSINQSADELFNKNEGFEVYSATRYEINEDSSEVLISKYRKDFEKNNSNDNEMIIQQVTNRREIRTKIVSPSMEFYDKEKHIKFFQDHDKKATETSEKNKLRSCISNKNKSEYSKKNKLKNMHEKNSFRLLECDSGESVLLHVKNTGNDEQYVECCQFIDAKNSNTDQFPELLKILHNTESNSKEKIKIQDKTNEKVSVHDKNIKNNEAIKKTEILDEIENIPDRTKLSTEKIGYESNNESSLNTLFAQKNSLVVSTDHMDHKNTSNKRDRIIKQKPLLNKIPSNTLIKDLIQNVSNVPTQSKKEHTKPNTPPAEFFINKNVENFSSDDQARDSSISTIIDLNANDLQGFDEICAKKCIEWKNINNKTENVPLKSIIKVKEDNEKIQPQKPIVCNKVTITEIIGGHSPQFEDLDYLKTKSISQSKIKMKPIENLNMRKSKSKTPEKKDSKSTDPLIFDKKIEEKPAINQTPIHTIIINKYEKREPYEPSYIEIIKRMLGMIGPKKFDEETEIDDDIKPSAVNASSQYTFKLPCSSKSMNTTVKMCPHYERDTQYPEDYILEEDEETQQARELLKGLNKVQVEKIRNGELIRISSRKSSPKAQRSGKSSPKALKSGKSSPKETK